MSDLKINPNSFPEERIDPLSPTQSMPTFLPKDSLSSLGHLTKIEKEIQVPALPTPKEPALSFLEFLAIVADAKASFKKLLREAEICRTNPSLQPMRQNLSQESQEIVSTMEAIDSASEQVEIKTTQLMNEIKTILAELEQLINQQNSEIEKITAGNEEQQKEIKQITASYQQYIEGLKKLGATLESEGVYILPDSEEAQAKYASLTSAYCASIDHFNEYGKNRVNEIKYYNQTAQQYNQTIATINQQLLKFSPYISPVPQMQQAPLITFTDPISAVCYPINLGDHSIQVPQLPAFISSIEQNSPTFLTPLSLPSLDLENIQKKINNYFDDQLVTPLSTQLQAQLARFSLQLSLSYQTVNGLNDKEAGLTVEKLRKESFFTQSSSDLSLDLLIGKKNSSTKISHREMVKILAANVMQNYLKEIKVQSDLSSFQLALLSSVQLNESLSYALSSLMQNMGPSLLHLPKDSSTANLLATISFSSHFIEQIKSGAFEQKIKACLEVIPDLSNLNAQNRQQLLSLLKTNQLLFVKKIIETNTGILNFSQLLPNAFLSKEMSHFLSQKENNPLLTDKFLEQSVQYFLSQNLSQDQAIFLANFHGNALQRHWFAQPSASIVTDKTIDQPLLIDSILAALLPFKQNNLNLNDLRLTATAAVETLLADNIPRPAESFKKELKIELEEAGVDLPLPFTDQLLLLSASSMKPLQLQSSDLSNHFQQIIGEQFGKEAPLEFEKNIYSLLEELSQLISAEILKLPSSTQTDLMIHSTKTNLEFEKFLDFFSNSVDIVTKPFLSSKEIKVNSSFYI